MSAPLFERMLMPLFPGMALRRMQARLAFDMATRAYDAAKPNRSTRNWRTSGASAKAEDGPALQMLRNRSRDLARNNPWARKARRQLPAHMVGTGVMPRPKDGAQRTRDRALGAWNAWAEATDLEVGHGFAGQQHLVAGTVVESGECLLLWTPEAKAPGGWTTRVLEPDYLDETFNEVSRNGTGRIINGIEFDQNNRRVAYWLFREHPGDIMPMLAPSMDRVRVEARFVDHVFEAARPGQVRGVPWMSASMLGLREMADYVDAERWRKKIAAALAAFVTTAAGPAQSSLGQVRTEAGPGQGGPRAIERIAPGTIKRLLPGEDVKFSQPPADQGLADYMRWELFAVCAGLGLPYAELTGDLSNANYSSMRLGKIEFWALLDTWQWLMLEPMLYRRAWNRVQSTSGVPGMMAEWSFPRRLWVDPAKDLKAERDAIRAGLVSQPDAIAQRGDDWRHVLNSQAEYLKEADRLGIVVDTDPRKTAENGAPSGVEAAPPGEDDSSSSPAGQSTPSTQPQN